MNVNLCVCMCVFELYIVGRRMNKFSLKGQLSMAPNDTCLLTKVC